jgi:hypothetical protein
LSRTRPHNKVRVAQLLPGTLARPARSPSPTPPAATVVTPLDAGNTLNGNPLPTGAAAYVYHPVTASFEEAQQTCACDGGHLAAYTTEGQQAAVENYFYDLGVLQPEFDPLYWIGLNTSDRAEPDWKWVDPALGRPGAYRHWGTFLYGDLTPEAEPNNLVDPESCVAANFTEAYTESPKPDAKVNPFGWADTSCNRAMTFMCRVATAGMAPYFTTNTTNVTYFLNTTQVNQTVAEAACNRAGGHLAAFTSIDEQLEVEAYYTRKGWLFPCVGQSYWIGLVTKDAKTWPSFAWTDVMVPRPSGRTYLNWGSNPNTNNTEPDNRCARRGAARGAARARVHPGAVHSAAPGDAAAADCLWRRPGAGLGASSASSPTAASWT